MKTSIVALVLTTLQQPACFIEVQARGERVGNGAGSAVGGAMLEAAITGGLQLSLERDERHHALLGFGGQRAVMTSRKIGIEHMNAPRLELGVQGRLRARSWLGDELTLRLALAGFHLAAGGNVSEVRVEGAARIGTDHVALMVGPALSYWDAARAGTTIGLGVVGALHIAGDPLQLFE